MKKYYFLIAISTVFLFTMSYTEIDSDSLFEQILDSAYYYAEKSDWETVATYLTTVRESYDFNKMQKKTAGLVLLILEKQREAERNALAEFSDNSANYVLFADFLKKIGYRLNSDEQSLYDTYKIESSLDNTVLIDAKGVFLMGKKQGDLNGDDHMVVLSPFKIDIHEVTNAQYVAYLNTAGVPYDTAAKNLAIGEDFCKIYYEDGHYYVEQGFEMYPVCVNWFGANDYARWAGKRLPTEAEWELVARGGPANPIDAYTIEELQQIADINPDSLRKVMQKDKNQAGVYDILDNVAEWCQDFYSEDYYKVLDINNPVYTKNTGGKVVRGGYFFGDFSVKNPYNRFKAKPQLTRKFIGFRCVKDIK